MTEWFRLASINCDYAWKSFNRTRVCEPISTLQQSSPICTHRAVTSCHQVDPTVPFRGGKLLGRVLKPYRGSIPKTSHQQHLHRRWFQKAQMQVYDARRLVLAHVLLRFDLSL